MPLRDHFHPPFTSRRHWEGFHGLWPAMMVMGLSRKLPQRYFAEPQVHLGSSIEIDVATFDEDEADWARRSRHWSSRPTRRTRTSTRCASTTRGTADGWWPRSRFGSLIHEIAARESLCSMRLCREFRRMRWTKNKVTRIGVWNFTHTIMMPLPEYNPHHRRAHSPCSLINVEQAHFNIRTTARTRAIRAAAR